MSWRRGRVYSRDLRDRVLAAVDGGERVAVVASTFKVSRSYIYKALGGGRRTGDSGPNPNRGHRRRKLTPEQERALGVYLQAHDDITLAALGAWLESTHQVRISSGALWMAVHRLGLSFKKKPYGGRTKPA